MKMHKALVSENRICQGMSILYFSKVPFLNELTINLLIYVMARE